MNGGILGNEGFHIIHTHSRTVDVSGIDNHEVTGLKMVDAAGLVHTHKGDAIAIMRQYAYHGSHRTIHSSAQIEAFRNHVDDRSIKVGGRQCITTHDNFVIPLNIINGLAYMDMYPCTREQYESTELPHIILTPDLVDITSKVDYMLTAEPDWYNLVADLAKHPYNSCFDECGRYLKREKTSPPAVPIEDSDDTPVDDPDDVPIREVSLHKLFESASDLNVRYICFESDSDIGNVQYEATKEIEVTKKPIDYRRYRAHLQHRHRGTSKCAGS